MKLKIKNLHEFALKINNKKVDISGTCNIEINQTEVGHIISVDLISEHGFFLMSENIECYILSNRNADIFLIISLNDKEYEFGGGYGFFIESSEIMMCNTKSEIEHVNIKMLSKYNETYPIKLIT